METKRADVLKQEISRHPLTPERLVALVNLAWDMEKEIMSEINQRIGEGREIWNLAQPLAKLWMVTKPAGTSAEAPKAVITFQGDSQDFEVSKGSWYHLHGNLNDLARTAAEVEAESVGWRGIITVDAVYDRFVKMSESLIRDQKLNLTVEEFVSGWKKPKSAIASVLYQQGWEKVAKGQYRYKLRAS